MTDELEAPSPKQLELDEIVAILRREISEEAIEDAYLNALNSDIPTIVVISEHWRSAAELLKQHDQLRFSYLRSVSGVDYESHMEVVYYLVSLNDKREVAVKVKTSRDEPSIPSVTPVWTTANWNEREIYDLLGIYFSDHPDLRRIMMPDDWVGHPLRKDYEPLDSEV